MPVPKYNKVKNLYSSSEVGTVADSLCALVFASSEAIHFFSQPLLPACLHFKTTPKMTKWSKYIQLYFFKTLPPSAYVPNAANIKTKSATFAFSSLLLFF